MFYKPGEYEIKGGEFFSAKSGLPLKKGDLVGMAVFCAPNDISPLETYGKEVVSSMRKLETYSGKPELYKSCVLKI